MLREVAGGRPLLLAVDDAHQLDAASALLVHQLVADFTTLVALTVRLGEPVPDPITALWKDELAERVDVGPLAREHVTALLGRSSVVRWIRQPTPCGGASPTATPSTSTSSWSGRSMPVTSSSPTACGRCGPAPPCRARLVDVVQSRLRNLDDDERRTLSLVAFGEPIGVALLEQVSDLRTLARLERLGLIVVAQARRRLDVRLAHPLHREVLRRETPALQARAAHRTLADLLEGTGARRREDGLRLAVWRLEGGGAIAAERLVAAATAAREAGDIDLAERLAAAGVDAGGGFAASFELGQCRQRNGEHAAALDILDALVGGEPDDDAISALADSPADITFWGLGREADGTAILAHALGRLPVASPRASDLQAMAAMVEAHVGRADRTLDLASPLMVDPTTSGFGLATIAAGIALANGGRPAEALARLDPLLALPDLPRAARASMLHVKTAALVELGRLADAETVAVESHRLALDAGDATARGCGSAVLAWTYTVMGRLDAARRFAVEASALFRATQVAVARRWALSIQLFALSQADRPAEAAAVVAALDALEPHDGRMHEPLEQLGRSRLEHAGGSLTIALARLDAAADELTASGQHARACSCSTSGPAWALPMSPGRWPPRRAATRRSMPRWRITSWPSQRGDATALADVAERFAAFGAELVAAEVAAAARDAFARDGDQQAAARWAARSRDLAQRCEGAATAGPRPRAPDRAADASRAGGRQRWSGPAAAAGPLPTSCTSRCARSRTTWPGCSTSWASTAATQLAEALST